MKGIKFLNNAALALFTATQSLVDAKGKAKKFEKKNLQLQKMMAKNAFLYDAHIVELTPNLFAMAKQLLDINQEDQHPIIEIKEVEINIEGFDFDKIEQTLTIEGYEKFIDERIALGKYPKNRKKFMMETASKIFNEIKNKKQKQDAQSTGTV
jgi:hypothetical protein